MFLLIDLGLIFLFSLFFIITYYVIEKMRISKFVFNLKLFVEGKFLIEGLIYGGIMTVFYLAIESINREFVIPLYLSLPVILLLVRNFYVGLVSGIPLLTYHTITNYYDNRILYSVIGSYILFITLQIVLFYFENFSVKFLVLSLWAALMYVFLVIHEYLTNGGMTSYSIEVLIGPYVANVALFLSMTWVLQFLESANILSESVSFNFSRYYRQSLKSTAIGKFIVSTKTEKAIYGIFEFDFDVQDTNEKNIEIRESILLDFEKQMPLNAILFRADLNRYGFFIPVFNKINISQLLNGNSKLNRDFNDPLKTIETIIKSRNITYITSWDAEVKISLKAGVVMYGLQEQSVDKMLALAEIALTQHNNILDGNCIQVYDSKKHLLKLEESIHISNMDKKITLDSYNSVFLPVYNPKLANISFVLSLMEKVDEIKTEETLIEFLEFFGWTEYFDRYGAWLAINKFRGELPLAMFYSPRVFIKDFDLPSFKSKIVKKGLSLKKIILIFDHKILKEVWQNSVFIENVELLHKNGVTFGISNFNSSYTEINSVPIKYIFKTKSEIKHDDKDRQEIVVYYDINDERDVKKIHHSVNCFVAGQFVGKNIVYEPVESKTITTLQQLLKNK